MRYGGNGVPKGCRRVSRGEACCVRARTAETDRNGMQAPPLPRVLERVPARNRFLCRGIGTPPPLRSPAREDSSTPTLLQRVADPPQSVARPSFSVLPVLARQARAR